MTLVLVEAMTENPGICLLCGQTPNDEFTGNPKAAVHAEGIDVNWGDDVYICIECAGLIADLVDRPSREKWDKLRRIAGKLHKELKSLRGEFESVSADRDVLLSAGKVLERAAKGLEHEEVEA